MWYEDFSQTSDEEVREVAGSPLRDFGEQGCAMSTYHVGKQLNTAGNGHAGSGRVGRLFERAHCGHGRGRVRARQRQFAPQPAQPLRRRYSQRRLARDTAHRFAERRRAGGGSADRTASFRYPVLGESPGGYHAMAARTAPGGRSEDRLFRREYRRCCGIGGGGGASTAHPRGGVARRPARSCGRRAGACARRPR